MNEQPPPLTISSWARVVIQPVLLVANTLALLAACLIFLQSVDGERPWTTLLIICLVIAIESYTTTIWLTHPSRRQFEHTKYRAAEILVLFLFLRLATWVIHGNWPALARWSDYLANPLLLFLDPYFIGAVIVGYAAWYRTITISNVFSRLAPDTAEQAYYAIPRHERIEANQPMPLDREALQRNFVQQFLMGAILLLALTALLSVDLDQVWRMENLLEGGIARLGLPPGMLAALLLYFLTGFLLLSQGRLAMMEARWLADDVVKSPGIDRQWYRRTFLLLVLIGLAAAFLPLGSTFALGRLLSLALYGIMLTISSIIYLFSIIIFSLISLLFPRQPLAEPEPIEPPRPFDIPPPQTALVNPDNTLQIIATSAFWAVAIVMSILAISFFLRERGFKFNKLLLRQIWAALGLWWRTLWQGVRLQAAEVRSSLQARWSRPSQSIPRPSPWRYVRLNSLPPREKVRYFYLSVVKRAGDEGVPRRQNETPSEFAGDLKAGWPDSSPEIDELTNAFLQARYSPQPVTEEDIPPIKALWRRVRASIRQRRQVRPSASSEE